MTDRLRRAQLVIRDLNTETTGGMIVAVKLDSDEA